MRSWNDSRSTISSALARLGWSIRLWAAVEGAARVVVVVALAAAASFAADRLLEGTIRLRLFLNVFILGVVVVAAWRWLLSRLFAPLSVESLALTLERRYPELGDGLLTAVESRSEGRPTALAVRAADDAASRIAAAPVQSIVRRSPVVGKAAAAAAVALLLTGIASVRPDFTSAWWRRTTLQSSEKYPRRTMLDPIGFDGGVCRAARGRNFVFRVRVDGMVPDRGEVLVRRDASGPVVRSTMQRDGTNGFRFVVGNILDAVRIQATAGDDRTEWLTLEPVEAPSVSRATLHVNYPDYMKTPSTDIAVRGVAIPLPVGASVKLKLEFSKPAVIPAGGPKFEALTSWNIAERSWTVVESESLRVALRDVDGIESLEPFPIDVTAVPDRRPAFERVELQGVGSVITRLAAVPVSLAVHDDCSIEQISFVATEAARTRRLPGRIEPGRNFVATPVCEIGAFEVKPGDKPVLTVEASDLPPAGPGLPPGPAVVCWSRQSSSAPIALEVVTEDELLGRLAARELNDRQRLEQVLRELKDARTTLRDAKGTEPKTASADRLRVEEVVQSLRKAGGDLQDLANAFHASALEVRNNRVGNSAMLQRIETGVAAPLAALAVESVPQRTREVEAAAAATGRPVFLDRRKTAVGGFDILVRDVEAVLRAMLKLEDYNELVAQLRKLRDEQADLLKKAKDERKRRILEITR